MLKRDDKPPWLARNPRERQRMEAWVNAKLDAIIATKQKEFSAMIADSVRLPRDTQRVILERQVAAARARLDADGGRARRDLAIQAAEEGDIEPLRKELMKIDPRYSRYVNFKRARGAAGHFKKKPPSDPLAPQHRLQEALFEYPLVISLWKQNYGKVNRPEGQVTAAAILAARWGLTAKEVENRRLSRQRLKRT